MDLRQRGVAHVNIFWSLVPMVLFFGAAGYGYLKHVEADENLVVRQQAAAAERAIKLRFDERERQLTQLTEVLGNPGKFLDPLVPIEDYTSPSDYVTPETLSRAFTAFKTRMNIPGSLKTLDEILNAAATELRKHTDQISGLESQLQSTRNELTSARSEVDNVRSEKDSRINELEANVRAEQAKLDRTVQTKETELAEARQKTREANEARESAVRDANVRIATKDVEIRDLRAANQRKADLTRLINSPAEPDGLVLSSSPATGLAWVDIGAKDMVKAGLEFRILEPVKGGQYKVKGHGTVTKVEHDRSQIKITHLENDLNPVVRNDIIANDLFSPGLKRHIYLLGRFATPYTKGEVQRILEAMGNVVHDTMSPSVDLVIVGREPIGEEATPLDQTEEFRKAAEWDVEVATLVKIRDFLKL